MKLYQSTKESPGDEGTSGPVWVLRDCQHDVPH